MGKLLLISLVLLGGYFLLRGGLGSRRPDQDGRVDRDARPPVEDMSPCPVCGTFRPSSLTSGCDRSDCPFS